jgi:AcrR family transcriptional regulator
MRQNQKLSGTREKALAAATTEFASFGLAGSRIDRIARSAGINKAMLYYHFGSKVGLYQAVIDLRIGQVSQVIAAIKREEATLNGILLTISRLYHEMLKPGDPFRSIFLHEMADGGERLKDALQRFIAKRGIPGRLKEFLEGGMRNGQFREFDIRQVILAFVGMNLFYLLLAPVANTIWEIDDEQEFRNARPEILVDLLLRGLLSPEV